MKAPTPVSSSLIEGDGAYNAFPGYVVAANGDLIALYRKGETHLSFDGRLYKATSRDGGRSWERELLSEACGETNGAANDDVRDVGAATLADGRILAIFDQRAGGDQLGGNTSWVIHSDDHGKTWSVPRQMVTGFSVGLSCFEAGPLELAGGELLVPGHGADRTGLDAYIRLLKSLDRGESWSDLRVRIESPVASEWSEPWICGLEDGRLLMMIRDDADRTAKACWSSDAGRTWSVPRPALGGCHSRPACLATPGGEVLALYRSPPRGWPACAASSDGGASWSEPSIWSQPEASGSFTYGQLQLDDAPGPAPAATAVLGQERNYSDHACDIWFVRFGVGDD